MPGSLIHWLTAPVEAVRLGRFTVAVFPVAAAIGGLTGATLTAVLFTGAGVGLGHAGVVIAAIIVGYPVLLALKRAVTGRAPLVAMHDAAAATVIGALVAKIVGTDVLASLDATSSGLVLLIAVGRVGCHHAGCCHGRPTTRGVMYPSERLGARARGFAQIPLARVQLTEAALSLFVAGLATFVSVTGQPGQGALTAGAGYGVARLLTELWRGDVGRPRVGPLSHGALTAGVLAAGCAALFIASGSGVIGVVTFIGILVGLVAHRRLGERRAPVEELAVALAVASERMVRAPRRVVPIPAGSVRLSAGPLARGKWHLTASANGSASALTSFDNLVSEVGRIRGQRGTVMDGSTSGIKHGVFGPPELAP